MVNVRQDAERRIAECGEEWESTKRNQQRQVESMQASLDAEIKTKLEVCILVFFNT